MVDSLIINVDLCDSDDDDNKKDDSDNDEGIVEFMIIQTWRMRMT